MVTVIILPFFFVFFAAGSFDAAKINATNSKTDNFPYSTCLFFPFAFGTSLFKG